MNASRNPTAVVTGASYGLGAVYADRLARQGNDLVLVARSRTDLERVAAEIREQTGQQVDVIVADLGAVDQLATVERRILDDDSISILVNNAGIGRLGALAEADPDVIEAMLALNVTALTRLASAAARRFTARGHGTIINVSSAMALRLPAGAAAYAATKAYVLGFSQALSAELQGSGVTVQAVLPGATRSRFWEDSGLDLDTFPDEIVMSSDDAVDAALAGLRSGEPVSILALPELVDWREYEAARTKLAAQSSSRTAAARYTLTADQA